MFVCCSEESVGKTVEKFKTTIMTLASCKDLILTDKPPTTGCAIITVSDKCVVHLLLKVHWYIIKFKKLVYSI